MSDHEQQEIARVAKKALTFLAGFSESADNKPSVHAGRVNKALTPGDITLLVKEGAMEGIGQVRGVLPATRTFNVETLETLADTTLQAVRDDIQRGGRIEIN